MLESDPEGLQRRRDRLGCLLLALPSDLPVAIFQGLEGCLQGFRTDLTFEAFDLLFHGRNLGGGFRWGIEPVLQLGGEAIEDGVDICVHLLCQLVI